VIQIFSGLLTLGVLLLSALLAVSAYVSEGLDLHLRLTSEQAAALVPQREGPSPLNLAVSRDEAVQLHARIRELGAEAPAIWGALAESLEKRIEFRQALTWYLWKAFFLAFGVLVVLSTLSFLLAGFDRTRV
jgi:hypothetical protein